MLAILTREQFLGLVLGLLVLALVALVLAIRHSRLSTLQFFGWWVAKFLTTFWWRTTVIGQLPLQPGQGAILVCNHRSSVDPFFMQTLSYRKMHWLVAREFCEHRLFAPFLKMCEVIPVNRSGMDVAATKTAIRLLHAGGLIGMFPEGRINMSEQLLLPMRPGVALIALKAQVPLIPIYIIGSPYRKTAWSPFFMPARVRVYIGQTIDLSSYYGREKEEGVLVEILTKAVQEIAGLAGEPHFQPQLAGRDWKPTQAQIDADIAAQEAREKNKIEEENGTDPA